LRIHDAAGGDHRQFHRAHHLRQQRKRSDLRAQIIRQEHAAMSARLHALCNDGVHPMRFEPERLVDGGRRGKYFRA
jgi:hypothetical protein